MRAKALALACALMGAGPGAQGQAVLPPPTTAAPTMPRGLPLGMGGNAATGPESMQGRSLLIEPRFLGRLTYTDNARATSSNGGSEFIGELTPGIGIFANTARFKGHLDARVRNVFYSGNTNRNSQTSFPTLGGEGALELVKQHLFIDGAASIGRGNASSFTGRAQGDFLNTSSSSEARMFSIGPRAQFRLWGEADATLTYRRTWLDTGARRFSQQELDQVGAHFKEDVHAAGPLGWAVDYDRSDSSYGTSGVSDSLVETTRGTLIWNVSPQFRLRGIFGHETNEFPGRPSQSGSIKGGGLDWRPSPRTDLSATTEDRVFGRSYDVRFHHRRPRSAFELSYARNIASTLQPIFGSQLDATIDQFLTALGLDKTDPVLRDKLGAILLGFDPALANQFFLQGFVTNNFYVDRHLRAAVSAIGLRNVLTLSFQRSDRDRLGSAVTNSPLDDFATFNNVKQTSTQLSLNHRLSALSSLDASLTHARSEGKGTSNADIRRLIASIGVTSQIGPKTLGTLTYRHQRANGSADFSENVLIATVNMTF